LLNASPNGLNINYRAGSEFVRANPRGFAHEAEQHRADLAIAFDGDADRVVLVDRAGHFFDGDTILATLASALHDRRELRAETVVITHMSNTGLHHYLARRSLKTCLVSNGDKYITEALLADRLTLGGEEIGHVIIHNQLTRLTGDGLRTMLTLLSEWARSAPRAALWELAGSFKKFPQIKAAVYTGRLGRPAPQDIPGLPELLTKVSEQIQDLVRPIVCRPASTEPYYRLMLEAYLTPVDVLAGQALRLAEHIQHALDCWGRPISIFDNVNGGMINLPR
jgi:phosphoglucosamine mutase